MAKPDLLHRECGSGLSPQDEATAHDIADQILAGDPEAVTYYGADFTGEPSSSTLSVIANHAISVARAMLQALG